MTHLEHIHTTITDTASATLFIRELVEQHLAYHPDDGAESGLWSALESGRVTSAQIELINQRMAEVFVLGVCPSEIVLDEIAARETFEALQQSCGWRVNHNTRRTSYVILTEAQTIAGAWLITDTCVRKQRRSAEYTLRCAVYYILEAQGALDSKAGWRAHTDAMSAANRLASGDVTMTETITIACRHWRVRVLISPYSVEKHT